MDKFSKNIIHYKSLEIECRPGGAHPLGEIVKTRLVALRIRISPGLSPDLVMDVRILQLIL